MKHEFLENLNNLNESTSFLYNENEFPSYPVPVGRRVKHLQHQQPNFNKVCKYSMFFGLFYSVYFYFMLRINGRGRWL